MKFSHTKLTTIIDCPMTYYLHYVRGISPITEKPALLTGSAVHWGIENDTDNLQQFFGKKFVDYDVNNHLAEAMVYGYKLYKDELMKEICREAFTGKSYEVTQEYHEVKLVAPVESHIFIGGHEFEGIIDLLLLTDKGFIVIDYKTSSGEVGIESYLSQIMKYVYLLKYNFPEVPILKIGIINIKKMNLRFRKNESVEDYVKRIRFEYECNDNKQIAYYEYTMDKLDNKRLKEFQDNLIRMCDFARTVDEEHLWYINFKNASAYGGSDYAPILYQEEDAYLKYKIKDIVYENGEAHHSRLCKPIDMILDGVIMNSYSEYKKVRDNLIKPMNDKDFERFLKKHYICDNELLDIYAINYENKI